MTTDEKLDSLMGVLDKTINTISNLNEVVEKTNQSIQVLSNDMELVKMKIKDDEQWKLEMEREKGQMRQALDPAQKEKQIYETEARGLIIDLEQRATSEAVENLAISDPTAREHFSIVSGGIKL